MTTNLQIDRAKLEAHFKGIRDVGAVLEEIGAVNPAQLVKLAPQYVQKLDQAAQMFPQPGFQRILAGTSTLLKTVHQFDLNRKLRYMVRPTIITSVAWDNVPAASLGAQAVVSSPYNGQPYRVCDIICTAAAPFRFSEFNIGGIDMAEPSRTRVTYNGAVGAPAAANRGIDFPQIKARDLIRGLDADWRPWTKVDFTSDATITLTPFNYGTTASSCTLTFLFRANPCGNIFSSKMLLSAAEATQKHALAAANYMGNVAPGLLDDWG